ncbi:MAG: hypothetical protein ABJE95_12865 [Byssovorax sp.]
MAKSPLLQRALCLAILGAPLALAGCSVGLDSVVYDLDAGGGGGGSGATTSSTSTTTGSSSSSTGGNPACGALPPFNNFSTADSLAGWTVLLPSNFQSVSAQMALPGGLTLTPKPVFNNGWFQSTIGPLLYREITGDFLITAHVRAVRVSNPEAPPGGQYNTAGLLARKPNEATWVLNDVGSQLTTVGAIDKVTTDGSTDKLPGDNGTPGSNLATLAICRLGDTFHLVRRFDGMMSPTVTTSHTFAPGVMPKTLQVGMIVGNYGGELDVEGVFDFVRFDCPMVDADCLKAAANSP